MLCENTSNAPCTIKIDTVPGRPPMKLTVQPREKVEIADGYCDPIGGASAGRMRDPIIVSLSGGRMRPLPGQYAPGYSAETYGRDAAASMAAPGNVAAFQAAMQDMATAMRAEFAAAIANLKADSDDRARAAESELEALRAENAALRKGHGLADGADTLPAGDESGEFELDVDGDPEAFVAGLAASQPGSDVIEVPADAVTPAATDVAPTRAELASRKRKELVNLAKSAGVKDISGKNKDQLAAAILGEAPPA